MVESLLTSTVAVMSSAHALSLTGERFGRWLVLSKAHKNQRGEIYWNCRCDCGVEKAVRANLLTTKQSTSCGCYHRDAVTIHGMSLSPTWKSWDSLWQRCCNPNAPDYNNYGGRGIKVAPEWSNFTRFLADMGERPEGTTLERKDVNGNYESSNCKWATPTEQQRNRRDAIRLTLNGVTKNVHDWAEQLGIPVTTLKSRSGARWPDHRVLTTPVRPKRPAARGMH